MRIGQELGRVAHDAQRPRDGSLRFLSQYNATDEIIGGRYSQTTARLFAPWEFSEYSNDRRVRDTVVTFLCLFAQFRDQLIDALPRRLIQARLIFTCVAIQHKVTSYF